MKKSRRESEFNWQLRQRLEENRKLYQSGPQLHIPDTVFARFVASYLGVNPWKVILPGSFFLALILRLVFGAGFSESVLGVLGG